MTVNKLEYFLENGYIHHWLVAGPQAIPILKQDTQAGGINANIVVQPDSDQQFIFTDEPVERAYLDLRGDRLRWIYRNCHVADHLVDVSFTSLQESRQCVWLYTRIKPNQKWETTFEFSTHHGVEVWLNGILLISQPDPIGVDRQIWLTSGVLENRENDLLIRLTWVGAGEGFVDLSCRLVNFPESVSDKDVTILIPTLAHRPARYQRLERLLEYAYLEQVVNHRGNGINLRWAEDLEERVKYCYQIQDKEENIYVEGDWDADPTTALDIGHPTRLFERQFWVVLKALGMEYFDQDLRYQKSFPIYVLDNAYSAVPYGTFYERNREALEDARKYTGSLFAEIAKMELGRWSDVNQEVIRNTTVKINRNEYGHLTDLVGTIGLYHRYKKEKSTPKEVVNLIRECVLRYPFTFMAQGESTDNRPEYEQILAYTAQYLAGQLFPKGIFPVRNIPGGVLRDEAANILLEWMKQKGRSGFQDWDSNLTFESILVALSHLTSLAKRSEIRDLAAILMDKMFFSMALNTFKGSFGSSHGRTHSAMLKSSQLEATSGITRILWGQGVFNQHILGTVSIACSEYEFPLMIGEIATQTTDDLLNKEQKVGINGETVNTITYRTAQENIELPMTLAHRKSRKEKKAWSDELLHSVGLYARRKHKLTQLSGGEQQRVAIAVALANKPVLLLGDEPTGEVDSATAQTIIDTFRRMSENMGLTTIIVTHDPRISDQVDRVVAIRDGKISTETIRQVSQLEQAMIGDRSGGDELIIRKEEVTFHEYVVLDSAGRLQIPRDLLEEFGIGKRAHMETGEQCIIIRPVESSEGGGGVKRLTLEEQLALLFTEEPPVPNKGFSLRRKKARAK